MPSPPDLVFLSSCGGRVRTTISFEKAQFPAFDPERPRYNASMTTHVDGRLVARGPTSLTEAERIHEHEASKLLTESQQAVG